MLKNYFKIAWRTILKHKGSSLIHVVGLALGMAVSALIALWVQHELTFDRFYSKSDRIYEVYNRGDFNNKTWAWSGQANPLSPVLQKDYPEIENISRYNSATLLLSDGETYFKSYGAYADSSFFKLFDFPFIAGEKKHALSSKKNIVLTISLAKKLWGRTDVVGKTVQVDSSASFAVSGVIQDIPQNSRFQGVSYFIPWSYFEENQLGPQMAASWTNIKVPTFILLTPSVKAETVTAKISQTLIKLGVSKNKLFLFPATKWHLYTKQENGNFVGGRIEMVKLFSLVSFLILVIACINFVNLSTAKSTQRAKEVGICKVIGAQKRTLIFQFLCESILLSLVAGITALFVLWAILPSFNSLLHTTITLRFSQSIFWLYAFGFILATGILAGIYPAFFLSSFRPISVLKGFFKDKNSSIPLRKILVILQFTATIALVISTFIIYQQIQYAKSRDNGYEKQRLISLPLTANRNRHFESIRQDLIASGSISSVTRTSGTITQHTFGATNFSWPGSTADDLNKAFVALTSDAAFKQTMGIKLLQGRDIDIRTYPTDSSAMLLNESAVKAMGLKEPIGTLVRNGEQQWHVVGVVSDFIFYSPYAAINPLFILGSGDWFNYMYLKLNPGKSIAANLAATEKVLKKYEPIEPFNYTFTDEAYEKNFESEQRTASLIALFSGTTLFVSCLGLFGLISYVIERRKKEISIRKILGATMQGIGLLLTKEFIAQIILAFIIASPIVYWTMENWLQNFTYRITMPWTAFAYTALLIVLIVGLTISMQLIKAVMTKPVDNLREE